MEEPEGPGVEEVVVVEEPEARVTAATVKKDIDNPNKFVILSPSYQLHTIATTTEKLHAYEYIPNESDLT